MSQLTDLIKEAREKYPTFAKKLQDYYDKEASRRGFGLVYESHLPEVFEIANHTIRKNDVVNIRSERGKFEANSSDRYVVTKLYTNDTGDKVANLKLLEEYEQYGVLSGVLVDTLIKTVSQEEVIYPGLTFDGEVIGNSDNDTFHTVIESENYDALRLLNSTDLIGKVDCIYIDPPYNTGNKDWIYNNDYVDGSDEFKSSAFMNFLERRLLEAKSLLNKDNSVLILTIDEKEYLHVGMLLKQVFPGAKIQMISSVIRPGGNTRVGEFSRSDEYLYIVQFGKSFPTPYSLGESWGENKSEVGARKKVFWAQLHRNGSDGVREKSPNCYYPVYVSQLEDGQVKVESIGNTVPLNQSVSTDETPENCVAVYPPSRKNGQLGRWCTTPENAKEFLSKGYIKAGSFNGSKTPMYFLQKGQREKIETGEYIVTEIAETNTAVVEISETNKVESIPTTQWNSKTHDASRHGSNLIASFLGEKRFDFPKSLYAVEDVLRFFVKSKPDATIIDFFGGSGTTAHAVMRLNEQDGGNRRSITITNNEISLQNNKKFSLKGLQAGDAEWEQYGVYEYATKPRLTAAITGKTAKSNFTEDVEGYYKYNDFQDEYPIGEAIPKDKAKQYKDGMKQNVKFFKLKYLAYRDIFLNDADEYLYPLIWLEQGQQGELPDDDIDAYASFDDYMIVKKLSKFDEAVQNMDANIKTIYVHADEDTAAQLQKTVSLDVEIVSVWDLYIQRMKAKTIK